MSYQSIEVAERANSSDKTNENETTVEYKLPAKPSILLELNEKLAPYMRPGSDRKSGFFKVTSRAKNEEIAQMHRRGIMDGNYDPKLTAIKRLP